MKAEDSNDAIRKANIEFKKYSDLEYLNSDYKITKWEFVKIMDIYETDVFEIDSDGTEIFSKTRNRKIESKPLMKVKKQ